MAHTLLLRAHVAWRHKVSCLVTDGQTGNVYGPNDVVEINKSSRHLLKMSVSTKNFLPFLLGATLTLASFAVTAMDFSFQLFSFDPTTKRLLLSGEIRRGDTQRLRQFLAENGEEYLRHPQVVLDSPGGNLDEALQLAQVLREVLADTIVIHPARCASACFFLYVASPIRFAEGAVIAIHRPFFAAETTRRLSAATADAAQNASYARAKRWLQDQLVPQVLIDKMFSLPSTQAYWLTRRDTMTLGNRAAWYEEWLLARCPNYLNAEEQSHAAGTAEERAATSAAMHDAIYCEGLALAPQRIDTLKGYVNANRQRKQ